MLKATGVCFIAIFLAVVYAQADVSFTVDVTGTFVDSSNKTACPACDCPDIEKACSYYDNVLCSDAQSEGADDNQVRWGTLSGNEYFCFKSSGLGFQGKRGITMVANADENTIIGKITHYNNVIRAGENLSSSPRYLQLKFTVTLSGMFDPFEIRYPLSFIETPNSDGNCDPAIQRTGTPCDDRLSFDADLLSDHFIYNNYQYTLSVAGFMQTGNTPIRAFITREKTANRANVYAKIITFCLESACGPNELFVRVPACQCICQLSNETCQRVFGDDWYVGKPSSGGGCSCLCGGDPNQCNASDPTNAWNPDRCACGCSLTDAQCRQVNPLFGVSLGDECVCECNKQKQMECNSINPFYRAVGDKCACECFLNDTICVELFGEKYGKHDELNCACIEPPTPSEPDLTDEEIAGIVIATVLGSLLIGAFLLAVLGVLVYLIMSGVIPGIYGYKIPSADLGAGSVNPGYSSPWSDASSALG